MITSTELLANLLDSEASNLKARAAYVRKDWKMLFEHLNNSRQIITTTVVAMVTDNSTDDKPEYSIAE